MIIDPIGDLLTRIRNAYMARINRCLKYLILKLKLISLKILKKNKYIADYSKLLKKIIKNQLLLL